MALFWLQREKEEEVVRRGRALFKEVTRDFGSFPMLEYLGWTAEKEDLFLDAPTLGLVAPIPWYVRSG